MALDIYEMRAEVIKALSNPIRLKIVDLLAKEEEKCVCDIVTEINAEQPTISKHLSVLKNAGILDSRQEGLMVLYRLRTPCVTDFLSCIDNIIITDLEARQNRFRGGEQA
jgi:ArsR family transcriptional regulator